MLSFSLGYKRWDIPSLGTILILIIRPNFEMVLIVKILLFSFLGGWGAHYERWDMPSLWAIIILIIWISSSQFCRRYQSLKRSTTALFNQQIVKGEKGKGSWDFLISGSFPSFLTRKVTSGKMLQECETTLKKWTLIMVLDGPGNCHKHQYLVHGRCRWMCCLCVHFCCHNFCYFSDLFVVVIFVIIVFLVVVFVLVLFSLLSLSSLSLSSLLLSLLLLSLLWLSSLWLSSLWLASFLLSSLWLSYLSLFLLSL